MIAPRKVTRWTVALVLGATTLGLGCDATPGRRIEADYIAPDKVLDFAQLYGANCAGCHGVNGRGGAALALANPTYLAIAGDDSIRRAIVDGVRGTPMPAFGRRSGGLLTDAQLDAIVNGIRTQWTTATAPATATAAATPTTGTASALASGSASVSASASPPPPYADASPGDPQRGAAVFAAACTRCHGKDGEGARTGSAITDGSYLALVSDQGLRTTVIAGRPDLGAPDWRGNFPDRAMTSQEVSDVVAWLAAQRLAFPGTPYQQTQRIVEPSSRPTEVHP